MRKRRCNPPWDHMNKSDYHPVLLFYPSSCRSLNPLSFALLGPHPYRFSSCYPGDVSERCPISTYSSPFPSFFPDSFPLRYPFHSSLSRPFVQAGPPSLIRSLSTEPHVSESIRAESRRGRSFTERDLSKQARHHPLASPPAHPSLPFSLSPTFSVFLPGREAWPVCWAGEKGERRGQ
ncbi:hypothetical protein JOQ06_025772, partial [Pogonophryne albipinna]